MRGIPTDDISAPEVDEPTMPYAAAVSALRAVLTTVALVWLYFAAPLTGHLTPSAGVVLAVGSVAFIGLWWWQVRSITRSRAPRLRALEVLGIAAPFLLLLFSTTYFLMARNDEAAFSQPLTRLDALYFTVTVFATVGFGDIVARSQTARAIVTFQMFGDLVVIGLGVRVLLGAVQVGLSRQRQRVRDDGSDTSPDDDGGKAIVSGGRSR